MANEKFLNTRIALRTGDYAYWTTGAGKDLELYKGEVCICTVAKADNQATTAPTVLFKVANANGQKFADLDWISALAADVYTWAKESSLYIKKDGTGNVVSGIEWDATANGGKGGIKFTTAAVATAEGLDELQKDVAALKKDVDDNRNSWNRDTDTKYDFKLIEGGDETLPEEEDYIGKLKIVATTYTNGVAGTPTTQYVDFVTLAELEAWGSQNYYTKTEVNNLISGIDTGVHSVALTGGTNQGTLKLTVDGTATDNIAVTGLGDLAFKDSLAKGDVGLGNVDNTSDANKPVSTAQAQAIATALAEAKKYADDNDANDNTEYHVEYDSVNKKIKLVVGADSTKMDIDATAFIKDGMIESVELVQEDASGNKGQFLKLTWNDDGKDVTYVPVGELVDVYTGSNGDEVNVAISNTNVVSASLNSNVATKIAHGEEAYGWGNHANAGYAKDADLGALAKKDKIVEGDIEGTIAVGKISGFNTAVAAVKVTNASNADTANTAMEANHADTANSATEATHAASADEATHAASATSADNSAKLGGKLPSEYATSAQGAKADTAVQSVSIGVVDPTVAPAIALTVDGTQTNVEFATERGLKVVGDNEATDTGKVNKLTFSIDTDVVFVLNCNW